MWLKQGLDGVPMTDEELETLEYILTNNSTLYSAVVHVPTVSQAKQISETTQQLRTVDIVRYIHQRLAQHQAEGETSCTLISGEIHKSMGLNNKMPSVCNAMYQAMGPKDVVLHTTPSGKSSTIQICYQLVGRSFPT